MGIFVNSETGQLNRLESISIKLMELASGWPTVASSTI